MVQTKKVYQCQKATQISKERRPRSIHFSAVKDDVLLAASELKECEFKLYIYLITNQEGYVLGLSRADVCARVNMSERSYTSAVNALIEKGYLQYTNDVAVDPDNNTAPLYIFNSITDANLAQS